MNYSGTSNIISICLGTEGFWTRLLFLPVLKLQTHRTEQNLPRVTNILECTWAHGEKNSLS